MFFHACKYLTGGVGVMLTFEGRYYGAVGSHLKKFTACRAMS